MFQKFQIIVQKFKNPNGKNLDVWVTIHLAQKNLLWDIRFHRGQFLNLVT